MPSRAHLKGAEIVEEEHQAQLQNEAVDRAMRRYEIARQLAREAFKGNDDVDVGYTGDADSTVEYVDAGYWVNARVFIYAEDVEERMR
jgi:hypothetical protein